MQGICYLRAKIQKRQKCSDPIKYLYVIYVILCFPNSKVLINSVSPTHSLNTRGGGLLPGLSVLLLLGCEGVSAGRPASCSGGRIG